MATSDFTYLSAKELSAAMEAPEVSSVELTQADAVGKTNVPLALGDLQTYNAV
ncbi:hypothetical protein [Streptomyces sp. GbtcB6]|uniref:hypothetical protein n=1 Tax=Streptomyces sp. GbtcB6 TaxID=2824751 RepID=UPI001C30500F|nr:hypothetical protein [Streptomyces sp. GbtcB6]